MGSFLIPAIMALGSGIANTISASSQAQQQRNNIRKAQIGLYENIVDEDELDKLLNTNERAFNTAISSTMNTSAVKTRGYSNAGTIGAALTAPIYGQKIQAEASIRDSAREQNANVRSRISELELGQPSEDPVGSFVAGAIPGLTAGMELNKYLEPSQVSPGMGGGAEPTGVTPQTGTERYNPLSLQNKPSMGLKINKPSYIDYLGEDQYNIDNTFDPFGLKRRPH